MNSYFDDRRINYQEAFNIQDPNEIFFLEEVLKEGLKLFEKLFKYKARFFVAPNGPFPNRLESVLNQCGIKYISQPKIQLEVLGYGKTRKVLHYLGMKNKYGQIYLTRNCYFEPGSPLKSDWINSCLKDIETAFRWKKPAIICSHRVNYIGGINVNNRQKSLLELKKLLNSIIRQWPDVEFISSDLLGKIIMESKQK
ncbi:MAG: hypothetical protein IH594_03150 [Bacteroidales bacterium]|nr:hypothetical protein [Bacteroidales bacterium]